MSLIVLLIWILGISTLYAFAMRIMWRVLAAFWSQWTYMYLYLEDRHIPQGGDESTLTQTKPGKTFHPPSRPAYADCQRKPCSPHTHTHRQAHSKLRAPLPHPNRQEWIIGVNVGRCGSEKGGRGDQTVLRGKGEDGEHWWTAVREGLREWQNR